VVAGDGKTDLSTFVSLRDITATIRKNAKPTGGTPGTGVAVVDSTGTGVKALKVFSTGRAAVAKTTIDARLRSVAETTVTDAHLQDKPGGTVALDWRTGHILAIAHTGADGDIAIDGIKSPGSTMKTPSPRRPCSTRRVSPRAVPRPVRTRSWPTVSCSTTTLE
jgi:hypothetical protein